MYLELSYKSDQYSSSCDGIAARSDDKPLRCKMLDLYLSGVGSDRPSADAILSSLKKDKVRRSRGLLPTDPTAMEQTLDDTLGRMLPGFFFLNSNRSILRRF
jgi:hypothetical protein